MYFGSLSYGLSYGQDRISFYYVPRLDARGIISPRIKPGNFTADMRIL